MGNMQTAQTDATVRKIPWRLICGSSLLLCGVAYSCRSPIVVINVNAIGRGLSGEVDEVRMLFWNPHLTAVTLSTASCNCSLDAPGNRVTIRPFHFAVQTALTRVVNGPKGKQGVALVSIESPVKSQLSMVIK